jgi:hypothetical protein
LAKSSANRPAINFGAVAFGGAFFGDVVLGDVAAAFNRGPLSTSENF